MKIVVFYLLLVLIGFAVGVYWSMLPGLKNYNQSRYNALTPPLRATAAPMPALSPASSDYVDVADYQWATYALTAAVVVAALLCLKVSKKDAPGDWVAVLCTIFILATGSIAFGIFYAYNQDIPSDSMNNFYIALGILAAGMLLILVAIWFSEDKFQTKNFAIIMLIASLTLGAALIFLWILESKFPSDVDKNKWLAAKIAVLTIIIVCFCVAALAFYKSRKKQQQRSNLDEL